MPDKTPAIDLKVNPIISTLFGPPLPWIIRRWVYQSRLARLRLASSETRSPVSRTVQTTSFSSGVLQALAGRDRRKSKMEIRRLALSRFVGLFGICVPHSSRQRIRRRSS